MKVSIRANLQPVRGSDVHPLRWAFEQGRQLGFDGLELCMTANASGFVSAWNETLRESTRALGREFGLSIYSLSADWAWAYATFFPQVKDWGKGVEWLAEDARLAKELGAHAILMHFATSKGRWEDCRAALKEAASAAEAQGVTFGYEANIWNLIDLGGYEGLIRMVDEVGSPNFGIYLHNAYPRAGYPLHQEIEMAGPRLVQAMHSSSLTDGRVEIDWPKATAAMQTYFPDGAYTFEIPWAEAADNKTCLDRTLTQAK